MKKIFLFFLAFCAVSASAQTRLATLSHNGEVTTFFGVTAFQQAMNAAVHGDAITLSSGVFTATNITKAVTLRGSGMSVGTDSIDAHDFTNIQGSFTITIPEDIPENLTMEGLNFSNTINIASLKNAMILKCRFGYVTYVNGSSTLRNCTFVHCRIAERFYLPNIADVKFVNSVVYGAISSASTSFFEFENSVLISYIPNNSTLKNCIILGDHVPGNSIAYNCVGYYDGRDDIFDYCHALSRNNRFVGAFSDLFVSYNNSYYDYFETEQFVLTESAKATYLGTDRKEVGLYGGTLPYNELPSTPRITKCNVASKSTADGKLSVEIEVKAAEN